MCAIDSEFLRGGGTWQERNAAALAERKGKRESSRLRQLGSFGSTQSASGEASRHPGCCLCLSALEDFLVRNYPSVYGKPVAHFWKPLRTEPHVCPPSVARPGGAVLREARFPQVACRFQGERDSGCTREQKGWPSPESENSSFLWTDPPVLFSRILSLLASGLEFHCALSCLQLADCRAGNSLASAIAWANSLR